MKLLAPPALLTILALAAIPRLAAAQPRCACPASGMGRIGRGMDDFGDALYTFGIGRAASITAATQLKVEFLDTYKARPPVPTVKKNDLAVLVSFVYKFE